MVTFRGFTPTVNRNRTATFLDWEASVQPWEYGSESVPDGQITARAFLDSLSTPQLLQLAIFKDFILPWTDRALVELSDMSGLSKGKHTNRYRD